MKTTKLATILFLWAAAPALRAQEPSTKEAQVEEILAITNAQSIVDQVWTQMRTMAAQQIPPDGNPQQKAAAEATMNRIFDRMREQMSWEKMKPGYIRIYSETFTEDELAGMLAFYKTPAGQAMIQKSPVVIAKSMALAQAQMASLLPEIERMTREELTKSKTAH